MSLQPEFNEDPGWQPLEEQQIYTQEELQAYERQRLAELEMLRNNGQVITMCFIYLFLFESINFMKRMLFISFLYLVTKKK